MPPLAKAAVLVLVHADRLARDIAHRPAPDTPALDRLVAAGVTTGLMLSARDHSSLDPPHSLAARVLAMAEAATSASGIVSIPADQVSTVLAAPPASARMFLVDARDDLRLADRAVADAVAAFPQRFTHEPARKANATVRQTASALVGVMLVGKGEWRPILPSPVWQGDDGTLQTPTQSFQAGAEERTLAGFVAWSGDGLVRKDGRMALAHVGTPPGESFLTLEQAVAEPLSKTGLLNKYGA